MGSCTNAVIDSRRAEAIITKLVKENRLREFSFHANGILQLHCYHDFFEDFHKASKMSVFCSSLFSPEMNRPF